MEETQKTLCFSVQGEFITNLAREWLFCEGKEFDKIIDLLESCMCGTDMSEKKIRRYAEDILIGRAETERRHGSRHIPHGHIRRG